MLRIPQFQPGTQVQVRYDPNNPARVAIASVAMPQAQGYRRCLRAAATAATADPMSQDWPIFRCLLIIIGLACANLACDDADSSVNGGAGAVGGAGGVGAAGGADGGVPIESSCSQLEITAPAGDVFVDGRYSGLTAPTLLNLEPGTHRVAVGSDAYYLHTFETAPHHGSCSVSFGEPQKLAPRLWKALHVDIPSIRGVETDCLVEPNLAELDAVYSLFESNLVGLGQAHSYQSLVWEITRVSTTGTVDITGGAGSYTLRPGDLGDVFALLDIAEYDTIFSGWKAQGENCVLDAWYVGLGWTPQDETKQMGFANLRLQAPNLVSHVEHLQSNDPGGFLHEWLHTVELYYEELGANMPEPAGGFPLHAAEVYGYTFPWLDWYEDFTRGKVVDLQGQGYRGMTPELMHRCTTRDAVLNPTDC